MPAALHTVQLTAYFGERDRAGDRLLADAVLDVHARHGLRAAVLLRGVQGFGGAHHRHTDRLLSLADDLPLTAVAVDRHDRALAALAELRALPGGGPALVTLEPAAPGLAPAPEPGAPARLTAVLGGRPSERAAGRLLRARGVAGATVLSGVAGSTGGARSPARRPPSLLVAIDAAGRLARVAAELRRLLAPAPVLVEPVTALKRDGRRTGARPPAGALTKITIFTSEQARQRGRPLHRALVEELARAGAAGATSLRGTWGYAGDGAPHGDTPWQLRRRVPVVVSVVDTAPRAARWWEIVDALTENTGLVTATTVQAPRADPPRAAPATGAVPDPALA